VSVSVRAAQIVVAVVVVTIVVAAVPIRIAVAEMIVARVAMVSVGGRSETEQDAGET